MNDKIKDLIHQISALEDELQSALQEQETRVSFFIKGKRVEFEKTVKDSHKRLKKSIIRWIIDDRPQNLLTAPVIYGLVIPLILFDLSVTLYQLLCFPIYKIAIVKRSDYIAFDRHHLGYLNWFEKIHCDYCAYINGLFAYATEIAARTEQYFCPIKHARKIIGTHKRYLSFMDYGDSENYHTRLEGFRTMLEHEMEKTKGINDPIL